jgi:fumarate hydratase subunit alpha
MAIPIQNIREAACQALIDASTVFSEDKIRAYEKFLAREVNENGKWVLEKILESAVISKQEGIPLCDDTGIPHPFLEVGENAEVGGNPYEILRAISQGIADALRKMPGRPMGVKGEGMERVAQIRGLYDDPGMVLPAPVNIRTIPGKALKITVLMCGGGPEIRSRTLPVYHEHNQSRLIEVVAAWAIEMSSKLGCTPCVPAIGVGRTQFEASSLMLEALKDGNFDIQNEEEQYITDKLNESGVGPLAIGGKATALAAFMKIGPQRASGIRAVTLRMGCCFDPRKATVTLQ